MSDATEQIRLQAMAALIAGQSYSQVSQMFGIPVGTLKTWRHRDRQSGGVVSEVETTKRARIGALLLEYIETTLETLKVQQVAFRDADWLKKQSASEIAILHGVTVDKTIRLLEGLAPDEESE
jgi:transposase